MKIRLFLLSVILLGGCDDPKTHNCPHPSIEQSKIDKICRIVIHNKYKYTIAYWINSNLYFQTLTFDKQPEIIWGTTGHSYLEYEWVTMPNLVNGTIHINSTEVLVLGQYNPDQQVPRSPPKEPPHEKPNHPSPEPDRTIRL